MIYVVSFSCFGNMGSKHLSIYICTAPYIIHPTVPCTSIELWYGIEFIKQAANKQGAETKLY